MKKRLKIVSILILLAALLCACGNSTDADGVSDADVVSDNDSYSIPENGQAEVQQQDMPAEQTVSEGEPLSVKTKQPTPSPIFPDPGKNKLFVIDFTQKGTIRDEKYDECGLCGFTVDGPDGEPLRFGCSDAVRTQSGALNIKPGAFLYNLDEIPGIKAVNFRYEAEVTDDIGAMGVTPAFSMRDRASVNSLKELQVISHEEADCNGYFNLFIRPCNYAKFVPNYTGKYITQIAYVYTGERVTADEIMTRAYGGYDASVGEHVAYDAAYSCLFTFDEDSLGDVDRTPDGYVSSFKVKGSDGKSYRFSCEKVMISDGIVSIEETGKLNLLSEIPGIYSAIFNGTHEDYCQIDMTLIYDPGSRTELDSLEGLPRSGLSTWATEDDTYLLSMDAFSSFFCLTSVNGCFSFSGMEVQYSGKSAEISKLYLDEDFYGRYVEGAYYDKGREIWAMYGAKTFYLLGRLDAPVYLTADQDVWGIEHFEVTGLYDIDSNIKDMDNDPLAVGDWIMVNLDGRDYHVDLPVCPLGHARTIKEGSPVTAPETTGELNVLVIPFYFSDQEKLATEENTELLYRMLGRVTDERGRTVDHSDEDDSFFSLSKYFDIASYGRLTVNSFVTDWYSMGKDTFEERQWTMLTDPERLLMEKWADSRYGGTGIDFDRDGDGIYDAVILVCAGDIDNADPAFAIQSVGGACQPTLAYDDSLLYGDGKPAINSHVLMNMTRFFDNGQLSANVLIHEFGHVLGLIDYYDVTYQGVNAVGGYDMQSDNCGDWNIFSKYAAGWIDPYVVTRDDIKKGITLTLDPFAVNGSAIVIPTANNKVDPDGTLNPFSEYIAVELFTPDGVNKYDAARYGLEDVTGVCIYHIDTRQYVIETNEVTHHTIHDYLNTNAYNADGMYAVEVIQKEGMNTFTTRFDRSRIDASDFFYKGDSFSAGTHSSFFSDGEFDDNSPVDFKITVQSISNGKATIRITKD